MSSSGPSCEPPNDTQITHCHIWSLASLASLSSEVRSPMPAATPPYDLAIVGASFSGLVAARTAAMRGLSVVVLDAKREAGHRVATTGILVKEAAEEIDIPHALTRRVYGVRLYAPS